MNFNYLMDNKLHDVLEECDVARVGIVEDSGKVGKIIVEYVPKSDNDDGKTIEKDYHR